MNAMRTFEFKAAANAARDAEQAEAAREAERVRRAAAEEAQAEREADQQRRATAQGKEQRWLEVRTDLAQRQKDLQSAATAAAARASEVQAGAAEAKARVRRTTAHVDDEAAAMGSQW